MRPTFGLVMAKAMDDDVLRSWSVVGVACRRCGDLTHSRNEGRSRLVLLVASARKKNSVRSGTAPPTYSILRISKLECVRVFS